MGLPIVFGLSQESQTLSIRVMESQNENKHSPIASVCINIEPKAGQLTGLGIPEIYHGELQVIAHNPYLQEISRTRVWSLYIYSGLSLLAFEVFLVLLCCQRTFIQELGSNKRIEEFSIKKKKLVLKKGPKNMQTLRRLYWGHIVFPRSLPLTLPSTYDVFECKSV